MQVSTPLNLMKIGRKIIGDAENESNLIFFLINIILNCILHLFA